MNVGQFGQVFTPIDIVQRMLSLRQNQGTVLEPSAGDGAFLRMLEKTAVGIEIDSSHAKKSGAQCMDYFDYPTHNKFNTIIGNPPYVRYQDITTTTRGKLNHTYLDRRSNLYLFFMEKSLRHLNDGGEMIFITPRDFLKLTAASKLNQLFYDNGTITDYIELGDTRVFAGVTPNCAIWRFVKGDFSRVTNGEQKTLLMDGQIAFVRDEYSVPFSDIFTVHVGAVSGMDSVFANAQYGNRDFVCSQTAATGGTRRMIYNVAHPVLYPHKKELLARKIRFFDERNWWQWGRMHYKSQLPRIYVNAKTRRVAPFFMHPSCDYDGSVLAIFPVHKNVDLQQLCDSLNAVDWDELGFVCDGRFIFGQRSLQCCMLPQSFANFAMLSHTFEQYNSALLNCNSINR